MRVVNAEVVRFKRHPGAKSTPKPFLLVVVRGEDLEMKSGDGALRLAEAHARKMGWNPRGRGDATPFSRYNLREVERTFKFHTPL